GVEGGQMRTGRMDGGGGGGGGGGLRASFGDRNGRSSALSHYGGDSQDWNQVKREIQYMFEGVNDKFSAMQKFDSRLANIERLLQNLAQRQPGGKPPEASSKVLEPPKPLDTIDEDWNVYSTSTRI
uniref:Uncharacterized protein n=1 Tax=Panagrolaimus sp. PS1159 TaxID=55785 RepID=A0AC35FM27_9BILA